jgi:integrase
MAKIDPQSFAAVIHGYLASPKFAALGPSTQEWIRRYLNVAEHPEVLGSFPVGVVRPSIVQGFLDGFADRPGAQKAARSALRFLEKWALVRDLLPFPITTGTEIVGSKGGHKPWTDVQVAVAETYARPDIARAITLAANTGQRGSDLFRMRRTDIENLDGRPGINVLQRKTSLQIWIPMTQPLMAAIEKWERRPAPLLLKPTGEPWGNRKQLSMAWERERDRNPQLATCAGLVLHGLRATACIRLRRAGATPQQIADMVGLSQSMVERYCRFADQKQSALAAVHHLDRMRTGLEQEQRNVTPNPIAKALKE